MGEFFVFTRKISLENWRGLVAWAKSRAESFTIYLYLDENTPELPGSPRYGDSLFGHRADVRREVNGKIAILRGALRSASGEDFLRHVQTDLPGIGCPLMSYDFVGNSGEAVLSVRDLNDVVCKTNAEVNAIEFSRELNLPAGSVRRVV